MNATGLNATSATIARFLMTRTMNANAFGFSHELNNLQLFV